MEDKALRDAVLAELDVHPGVESARIGVTVRDGVVTLTGRVPSYAQRRRAEDVAKRVRGLRGLVEEIAVLPSGRGDTDEEIARRALQTLSWSSSLPADAVQVIVQGGVVKLSGELRHDYQRRSAVDVIASLEGVVDVIDQIALVPPAQAGDLKSTITDSLSRCDLDADRVRVEVSGAEVTLLGELETWFQRELAEHVAWSAAGVVHVDNRLTVTARTGRGRDTSKIG